MLVYMKLFVLTFNIVSVWNNKLTENFLDVKIFIDLFAYSRLFNNYKVFINVMC